MILDLSDVLPRNTLTTIAVTVPHNRPLLPSFLCFLPDTILDSRSVAVVHLCCSAAASPAHFVENTNLRKLFFQPQNQMLSM